MSLTEQEKQSIRDEEIFRAEVRRGLAIEKGPPSLLDGISRFFETKAGFWILTTVLAGLVATGLTAIQRYVDRDEIATREAAERARRDTDTLLKLGPMLTSEKRSQIEVAMVLLDGLASDRAVEARIAGQVKALVQNALIAGSRPSATPEERTQADAILNYADRARITAVQNTELQNTSSPGGSTNYSSAAINDIALPLRVYIQINSETDRQAARTAADAFRGAGIVAPGIEMVPTKNSPQQNSIRYCEGKVDVDAPERVRAVAARVLPSELKLVVLDTRLCGKVRLNHFELWFARKAL